MSNLKNILIGTFIFVNSLPFAIVLAGSSETCETKIGEISVFTVVDTSFEMQSGLIKNGNADSIKKYLPDGKSVSSLNTFVIKTGKKNILVDAGNGAHLLTNLKSIGISPDSISLILITHGHFDHVQGLIKDGNAVFKNAKVMFSEKEKVLYEDKSIEAVPAEYKQYFMAANKVLKVYGEKISTFAFGASVAEGITAVDMNGHTAGHTGYLIESKGQKMLIAGDFLHIAPVQFPHPEYSLVYDADINGAATTRKQILDKLSKEMILLAAMHVQFPGIGKVTTGTEGYVFTPVK